MADEAIQSRKEVLARLAALAGALSPEELALVANRTVPELERALSLRYPTIATMSQDQLRVLLERAAAPAAPVRKRKQVAGEDTATTAPPPVEVSLPAPQADTPPLAEPAPAGGAGAWASEAWGIGPGPAPSAPTVRGGADLQSKLDEANARLDALNARVEQLEGLVERTYQLSSRTVGMVEALGQGLAGVEALASGGATASSIRHLAAVVYDLRLRVIGDTRSPDKLQAATAVVERTDWKAYYFAKGPLPQD